MRFALRLSHRPFLAARARLFHRPFIARLQHDDEKCTIIKNFIPFGLFLFRLRLNRRGHRRVKGQKLL